MEEKHQNQNQNQNKLLRKEDKKSNSHYFINPWKEEQEKRKKDAFWYSGEESSEHARPVPMSEVIWTWLNAGKIALSKENDKESRITLFQAVSSKKESKNDASKDLYTLFQALRIV